MRLTTSGARPSPGVALSDDGRWLVGAGRVTLRLERGDRGVGLGGASAQIGGALSELARSAITPRQLGELRAVLRDARLGPPHRAVLLVLGDGTIDLCNARVRQRRDRAHRLGVALVLRATREEEDVRLHPLPVEDAGRQAEDGVEVGW